MTQKTRRTNLAGSLWPYCIGLSILCTVCILHVRVLLIDDGFIAHRYAANLVRGYGLVFNQGRRVEGVSDLSWVLLMTIPQVLGWRPELFAMIVGAISGIAALVITFRTCTCTLHLPRPLTFLVLCAGVCNADYWITEGNGIESGLYTLVVVSAYALLLERRLISAGAVLGFATTLRPESLLLAPIALLCLALHSEQHLDFRAAKIGRTLWASRVLLFPWAILVLGVLIWRFLYYGELLPNTVIAKSHPLHLRDLYFGSKYLFLFTLEAAPWVVLPFVGFLANIDLAFTLGFSWLGYQILVIMLNGGDWMFGFRFMSVFFPVLVLLSTRSMHQLVQEFNNRKYGRPIILGGLVLLAMITQVDNKSWTLDHGILSSTALPDIIPAMYEPYYLNLANVLKPALRPTDIVAPEVLGIVSYTLLENPMHDWLGLVDSYVAHHGTVYFPTFGKADPSYSVDVVAPTVFAFASGAGTLEMFEKYTKGSFRRRYGCWEVVGQPIILAIRHDREGGLLKVLRQSKLQIQAFHFRKD